MRPYPANLKAGTVHVLRDWNRAGEAASGTGYCFGLTSSSEVFWPSLEGRALSFAAWQARLILKTPLRKLYLVRNSWRNTASTTAQNVVARPSFPQWKRSGKRGPFTIASNWLTSRPEFRFPDGCRKWKREFPPCKSPERGRGCGQLCQTGSWKALYHADLKTWKAFRGLCLLARRSALREIRSVSKKSGRVPEMKRIFPAP